MPTGIARCVGFLDLFSWKSVKSEIVDFAIAHPASHNPTTRRRNQ